MKYLDIHQTDMKASNIVLGCMRLCQLDEKAAEKYILKSLDLGINFYDHANIYGGNGLCESIFGKILKNNPSIREKMIIQTKCGIHRNYEAGFTYFDFSKEHILESVDESLERLQTDYIDVLLLHRPDTLFVPEEVNEAFNELKKSGKVCHFGVSNQTPMQVELLQSGCDEKLLFNQLQFSVVHTPMLDHGLTMNMAIDHSVDRTGSILEYSRLKKMTVQAWSPFQTRMFEGSYIGDTKEFKELNLLLEELAKKYNTNVNAIAVAFILRHPANMQVILGTMNEKRLVESCEGSEIVLTREEWYQLYKAAGNPIV